VDNLVSLRKSELSHFAGSLSALRLEDLNRALEMALDTD